MPQGQGFRGLKLWGGGVQMLSGGIHYIFLWSFLTTSAFFYHKLVLLLTETRLDFVHILQWELKDMWNHIFRPKLKEQIYSLGQVRFF